jgi:hypothetical protein
MMPFKLHILSCGSSASSDGAFQKFARFLGVEADLVPLSAELATAPEDLLAAPAQGRVLAMGYSTLQHLLRREWFAGLLNETGFTLVYDFAPADDECKELKYLTGDALNSVVSSSSGQKRVSIHEDVKFGNFPMSGRCYMVDSGCPAVFSPARPDAALETYITVNGSPYFVCARRGRSSVFLLAESGLVDIETTIAPNTSLRQWYAQLIAMGIFLRSTFGPACWTAPVTGATLILDDPYVKPRYGFVHYETLLRELERTGAALTLAFIPFNHARSDPQTIELLRQHADRFSIAVHGCDHTGGEFAGVDEKWLIGAADCALNRMDSHFRKTQMPFDRIMVFPQGRFSTRAIRALKICGFDAAVNTSPWPEDFHGNSLTVQDLLGVAVTRYENFPIFVRRPPDDIFGDAFDAFFQKPVLAGEHHGFFRHGYGLFNRFIQDLSSLKTNLAWMPLGQTIAKSCVVRRDGGNRAVVRHFARVLKFRNPADEILTCSFEKPEQGDGVEGVLLNGRKAPFVVGGGFLKYETALQPREELTATVLQCQRKRASRRTSLKYVINSSARRILSDLRDNYLARNERLLAMAESVKGKLAGSRNGPKQEKKTGHAQDRF